MLLYWECIKLAIERGSKHFDFGRCTIGSGTHRFKKQWGALPVQLYWQYLMDAEGEIPQFDPSNPKYRTAIQIWQHLPVQITKLLGPLIVRNIP